MTNPIVASERVLSVFVEVELDHASAHFREIPSSEHFQTLLDAMYAYQWWKQKRGDSRTAIAEKMMVTSVGQIMPVLLRTMGEELGPLVTGASEQPKSKKS